MPEIREVSRKCRYRFTGAAYGKAILHSCKHVSNSVNGVFIGYVDSETEEHVLTEAIPLFHVHFLSPMLKLAFILVRFEIHF